MKKFKLSKAIIPNSFTAANLLCGFVSIVLADDNQYRYAAIAILIGAIFDALDGLVARLVGTSSEFGVELDSLADVVTFGVAPGFLIYHSFLYQLGIWGMLVAACLPIFGAFRLARFNIQVEDLNTKIDFRGLPIPSSAIIISSLVLAFHNGNGFNGWISDFIIPIVIILSLLMISDVRYDTLPSLKKKPRKISVFYFIIFIALVLIGSLTINEILFYFFSVFVLFGVARQIYYFLFPSKIENEG